MKKKYIDVYGNGKYQNHKSGCFWRGKTDLN